MPANYYIHNIYNADVSSQFGKEQIQRQLEFQLSQINALNQRMKADYKKAFGVVTPYNKAIKELEQKLPQAAVQMVNNLPTVNFAAIRSALGAKDLSDAVRIDKLQKAINDMRADLTEYENLYNTITEENDTSEGAKWFSQADLNRLQTFINRIIKAKNELDKIDLKADNVWGIQQGLATMITTAGGYISEYALTDLLNSSPNNTGVSFTQSGTKGSKAGGYQVSTSDISATLSNNSGTITVNLPSITLKRTGTGKGKKNPAINIHLKTTSVGQLIELSDMAHGGFNLETFYNAYANANRIALNLKTRSEVVNQVKGMNNLYRAFKTAALATALTGSMNTSDFAYYLVVNDEVYTATDIITGVLNGNGSVINGTKLFSLKNQTPDALLNTSSPVGLEAAQPLIAEKHYQLFREKYLTSLDDQVEAEARSVEIINIINALNISLNLKMNLNQLMPL